MTEFDWHLQPHFKGSDSSDALSEVQSFCFFKPRQTRTKPDLLLQGRWGANTDGWSGTLYSKRVRTQRMHTTRYNSGDFPDVTQLFQMVPFKRYACLQSWRVTHNTETIEAILLANKFRSRKLPGMILGTRCPTAQKDSTLQGFAFAGTRVKQTCDWMHSIFSHVYWQLAVKLSKGVGTYLYHQRKILPRAIQIPGKVAVVYMKTGGVPWINSLLLGFYQCKDT
jgi:hypothetical protein